MKKEILRFDALIEPMMKYSLKYRIVLNDIKQFIHFSKKKNCKLPKFLVDFFVR